MNYRNNKPSTVQSAVKSVISVNGGVSEERLYGLMFYVETYIAEHKGDRLTSVTWRRTGNGPHSPEVERVLDGINASATDTKTGEPLYTDSDAKSMKTNKHKYHREIVHAVQKAKSRSTKNLLDEYPKKVSVYNNAKSGDDLDFDTYVDDVACPPWEKSQFQSNVKTEKVAEADD